MTLFGEVELSYNVRVFGGFGGGVVFLAEWRLSIATWIVWDVQGVFRHRDLGSVRPQGAVYVL